MDNAGAEEEHPVEERQTLDHHLADPWRAKQPERERQMDLVARAMRERIGDE